MRGLALVAMTIYHFTWDLEFYGWILPGTTLQSGWVIFARFIATSFLFLVGISLVLAHGETIHWRGFWKRFLQIVVAAAAISVSTYFAFPDTYIFFGILHAIAVFSLLALMVIRLHWLFAASIAVVILLLWKTTSSEIFDQPLLKWIGLGIIPPDTNDYVPVFPWFAATIAGVAVAKLMQSMGVLQRIGAIDFPTFLSRPLVFIGRHSLIYYLVHQPLMLGSLWVFATIAGPPDRTESFLHLCTKQCLSLIHI